MISQYNCGALVLSRDSETPVPARHKRKTSYTCNMSRILKRSSKGLRVHKLICNIFVVCMCVMYSLCCNTVNKNIKKVTSSSDELCQIPIKRIHDYYP